MDSLQYLLLKIHQTKRGKSDLDPHEKTGLTVGFWQIPPIQYSQIIGYRITAQRHIADGRPSVSPIGTIGQ